MDTRYERQLKRGVLEIVVLKLLSQGRAYGYQLLQRLDQESGGLFRIKEGTLYPILYRLEDDGLVVSEWSIPEDKSVAKILPLYAERGGGPRRAAGALAQI